MTFFFLEKIGVLSTIPLQESYDLSCSTISLTLICPHRYTETMTNLFFFSVFLRQIGQNDNSSFNLLALQYKYPNNRSHHQVYFDTRWRTPKKLEVHNYLQKHIDTKLNGFLVKRDVKQNL